MKERGWRKRTAMLLGVQWKRETRESGTFAEEIDLVAVHNGTTVNASYAAHNAIYRGDNKQPFL